MNKERLTKRIFEWYQQQKERSRNSWKQEVTTGMRAKKINNMEWINREEWRKNNKI
jgi:hypothetical protein